MNATDVAIYDVRVRGHLDDHWATWLGGFTLDRHLDGTTILTAEVADQAQLHGLLSGLRDVGIDILELRTGDPRAHEPRREAAIPRPLHTPNLRLRAAVPDDAKITWKYRQRAEINEWLTGCPETFAGYRTLFNGPERLATTVVIELRGGPVIGDLLFRRHDATSHTAVATRAAGQVVELGWVLDPAHAARGHAAEAVTELLRHCFENLCVHRVTAGCLARDETSWRLMERLGMRREAHTRGGALHRSGTWLDTFTYALRADDWASSH